MNLLLATGLYFIICFLIWKELEKGNNLCLCVNYTCKNTFNYEGKHCKNQKRPQLNFTYKKYDLFLLHL